MKQPLHNFMLLFSFSLFIITSSYAQFVQQRRVIAVKDAISFIDKNKCYPLMLILYNRANIANTAEYEAKKKQVHDLVDETTFEQSKYNLTKKTQDIIKLSQARVAEINKKLRYHFIVIKSYSDDPTKHVVYFLQHCLPASETYIPMKHVSNYFKITLNSKADAGIGPHQIIFNQKSKL